MAEIAQPPVIPGQTFVPPSGPPNSMEIDGAVAQAPAPVPPAIAPETGLPVEPSETLYIQNLNEKVKIERECSCLPHFLVANVACGRDEIDITITFQGVRQSIRRRCAREPTNARSGVRII
jgi:hypothetical protein